jgi:hypothetical protein
MMDDMLQRYVLICSSGTGICFSLRDKLGRPGPAVIWVEVLTYLKIYSVLWLNITAVVSNLQPAAFYNVARG